MGRLGRLVGVGVFAAVVTACGCAFDKKKPYATDPLLSRGRGVWGDTENGRRAVLIPVPEPAAPQPPAGPLLGSPLVAVETSRPVTSP
ncbi:MAG: hypothetical protein JWO38_7948 [Gemmataceae bacterium]|nr:hypothetical protein [Gemmataceae bacterium]